MSNKTIKVTTVVVGIYQLTFKDHPTEKIELPIVLKDIKGIKNMQTCLDLLLNSISTFKCEVKLLFVYNLYAKK